MKPSRRFLVFSAAVLTIALPAANAQEIAGPAPNIPQFLQHESVTQIRTDRLMGVARASFCGHVMRLMQRYRLQQPNSNHAEQLHLPHLSVGLTPGDLKLINIQLVSAGHAECGPIFQLTLQNCSDVPIGNFHASVVGVAGQIQAHSPTVDAFIQRMEPQQTLTIQMQLPAACMSMRNAQGVAPFDTLVVALDSHDVLMESDEWNNIQILRKEEIGILAPPPNPVAQPVAPAVVDPLDAPRVESPQENDGDIDLDQLDLRDILR